MELDSEIAAGFAVAAIVAGDGALSAVRAGLAPTLAARLTPPGPPLSRARLPSLLPALAAGVPAAAVVLPRLRAVVAPRLPADLAASYLSDVPLPRPGHRPSDALRDWARRALGAAGAR
jgi:hypothetical protein